MNGDLKTNNQKTTTILQVQNLTVCYGMVKALENVSFHVNKGEIVAMIGSNGAGKSTALKAVSNILEASGGRIENGDIFFEEMSIKGLRSDQMVLKGISLVPEGRRVFPTMTVWENLEMGAFTVVSGWLLDVSKFRNPKTNNQQLKTRLDEVFELFPVLYERRKQKAGALSGGEQQMLAIGRALMLKPKLLMADEPSLGLSPNYVDMIFDKLIEINKNGTSILLVEQNALMALEICHRGYVFETGCIALDGTKEFLLKNEKIKRSFLGEKD